MTCNLVGDEVLEAALEVVRGSYELTDAEITAPLCGLKVNDLGKVVGAYAQALAELLPDFSCGPALFIGFFSYEKVKPVKPTLYG